MTQICWPVSPGPPLESMHHIKKRKLCPRPIESFTGRLDILDKVQRYYDSNTKSRHVFVLHGLGGSGKSQLAFKFLHDCQASNRYASMGLSTTISCNLSNIISASQRFSMLMLPMSRHFKQILRPSLLIVLSGLWMQLGAGLQVKVEKHGSSSLIMQMMCG